MSSFEYVSGDEVKLDDLVQVNRSFRRPLNGTVIQVYDPTKPSVPGGDNDFGYTVRLEDGNFLFAGSKDPKVRLVARS